jgi:hypothetical protein
MAGQYGSDSAEQTVRIMFQGIEIALKLGGSGVKNLAELIYASTKDGKNLNMRSGEVKKVRELLKENKPLHTYKLDMNELKRFRNLSMQYGLLYTIVKDKRNDDGMCTVILKEEEVTLLNDITEQMGLEKVTPQKDNKSREDISVPDKVKKNEDRSKSSSRSMIKDTKPSVKKKLEMEKSKITDKVKNKIKKRVR